MGKKGKGKKDNNQEEHEEVEKKQQQGENKDNKENEDEPEVQVLKPKKVQYCPICSFPFELCKYGKKAPECKKFLTEIAPTKVSKYHPDTPLSNQHQEQQKKEQKKVEEPKQKKEVKKQKSVKDKYLLIDVKNRDKKKFTTEISGLKIFDVDSKELAKKLSKKFACSCSATDEDKVMVQGDFFEDVKEILINQYKVKKKYILDKEEYKEKVGQEKEKKKQEKKKDKNVIPEEPEKNEQDEPPQPEGPKFKNKMQEALAHLDDEEDD